MCQDLAAAVRSGGQSPATDLPPSARRRGEDYSDHHRSGWSAKAYLVLRQAFGGTLLLGLEILVAADLIRTIAVAPTLNNVFQLGLIVVIRTFLSFSLETEIEGVPPWRRALIGGAGTIRRASASALESETPPRQP